MGAEIALGVGGVPRQAARCCAGIGGAVREISEIYVGVNGLPRLAWSPGSDRLFGLTLTSTLSELDCQTLLVLKATGVKYAAVGGMRRRLYLRGSGGNTLTRVNPDSFAVMATSGTGFVNGMDGTAQQLFAGYGTNKLAELEPDSMAVLKNDAAGRVVYDVMCTADRLFACVYAGSSKCDLTRLDPATMATVSVGTRYAVTNKFGGTSGSCYMTNSSDAIWIYDPATWVSSFYRYNCGFGADMGGIKK